MDFCNETIEMKCGTTSQSNRRARKNFRNMRDKNKLKRNYVTVSNFCEATGKKKNFNAELRNCLIVELERISKKPPLKTTLNVELTFLKRPNSCECGTT